MPKNISQDGRTDKMSYGKYLPSKHHLRKAKPNRKSERRFASGTSRVEMKTGKAFFYFSKSFFFRAQSYNLFRYFSSQTYKMPCCLRNYHAANFVLNKSARIIQCVPQFLHRFTMVENSQEYRLKHWATRSSVRSFVRTAHSFVCSRLLASLAPSAALTRSLARSLRSLPRL